jgi:hypothetical protein
MYASLTPMPDVRERAPAVVAHPDGMEYGGQRLTSGFHDDHGAATPWRLIVSTEST